MSRTLISLNPIAQVMLTISLALTSCSKKDVTLSPPVITPESTLSKTVSGPSSNWGIDFKVTPIKDAVATHQNWGKAVSYVRFAEGGCATGFFISEDGLFLTNHHVISRSRCSSDRCAGIQIVHQFNPNGLMTPYNKFKVLAQNNDLDYALIKVELGPEEKVDYLNLSGPNWNLEAGFKDSLAIIGHTFCGSIQSSQATFSDYDNDKMILNSVASSGNSGSPLIDEVTGTVVGLYHESHWDKETIRRDGTDVAHVGGAIKISSVVASIKKAYPSFVIEGVNANMFSDVTKDPLVLDVLPSTRSEILSKKPETVQEALDALVGQGIGMEEESQWVDILIGKLTDSEISVTDSQMVVSYLTQINLSRKVNIALSAGQIGQLISLMADAYGSKNLADLLNIQYGSMQLADCLNEMTQYANTRLLRSLYSARYCNATNLDSTLDTASSVLKTVVDYFADETTSKDKYILGRALSIIRKEAVLGQIDASNLDSVNIVLKTIYDKAETLSMMMGADAIYTFLQRDPKLLQAGQFTDTF